MKVGFVALIGRPNVGKSSLLNAVLNYKVAITSDKPQTTRDQIKGIYNDSDSQIIFIDTPGIHKPKKLLGESLNEKSYKSTKDIDIAIFLQPANEEIGTGDKKIINKIANIKTVAVISKVDKIDKESLEKKVEQLKSIGFNDVLATSINLRASIDTIISYIKEKLPEGNPFYDREQITDKSMRFLAKEIIRESAINFTRYEIPHSIGVIITDFDESKIPDKYFIEATIFVERDSQKGILVGKHGSMIKKIGTSARKKIAFTFNHKIHLDLRIKVKKNWTSKPEEIIKMGY